MNPFIFFLLISVGARAPPQPVVAPPPPPPPSNGGAPVPIREFDTRLWAYGGVEPPPIPVTVVSAPRELIPIRTEQIRKAIPY